MAAVVHNKALLTGFVSTVAVPPAFRERYGTPDQIHAKLEADYARIRRSGITPVVFLFDPTKQEQALKDFEARLKETKYDAIGIGAGVRLHPDYTVLFETMVNICGKLAPGTPLLFNDGPGGSSETLERVLDVKIPL